MQALLASVHHYAIWDDHDFGPNDSDNSFFNQDATREAFKLFWGNTGYGIKGLPCITGTFEWSDVQFFLMDNRSFRSSNNRITGERSYLGKVQTEWLISALKASTATFKIIAIGGQVINPAQVFENYSNYGEERNYLLEMIRKEKISGVFFLSGDRHHTELSMMDREGTYPLYDLTVSPLTSRPYDSANENNPLRVAGTMYSQRNFGILEFTGDRSGRNMKIIICNEKGDIVWERDIRPDALR